MIKPKIRNKKAGAKLLSIWWVLVLVIIAAGIVIGVLMFYSDKIDARIFEADLLANRIFDCIVYNGVIEEEVSVSGFDVFSFCNLNKDYIEKSGYYYINISLFNLKLKKVNLELIYGNSAFEKDCPIGSSYIQAENYPRCSFKEAIIYNEKGEKIKLTILAGANQEYRPEN